MMIGRKLFAVRSLLTTLLVLLPLTAVAQDQNRLLGEVDVQGKTKIDKTSGVWVDGQYLGYVDELTGDKKILLLPGAHEIVFRQNGYLEQKQKITVEPGQKQTINVSMQSDPQAQFPSGATAEVKLKVNPDRAAVFVDGSYAGTVKEFGGIGRAMVIAPGQHHVKIGLAGYQDFNTDVILRPNQKVTIKTELVPGSITQAGPEIKSN